MMGDCNALDAKCINEVRCGPTTDFHFNPVNSVCSQIGPGIPDLCSHDATGCPDGGFVTEWAADVPSGTAAANGVYRHQCVPTVDERHIDANDVPCN